MIQTKLKHLKDCGIYEICLTIKTKSVLLSDESF